MQPTPSALREFKASIEVAASKLHLELLFDDGMFLLRHNDIDAYYCSFRPIRKDVKRKVQR